jgi:hypothetical protein
MPNPGPGGVGQIAPVAVMVIRPVTFPERSGRSVACVGGAQPAERRAQVNAEVTVRRVRLRSRVMLAAAVALILVLFGLGIPVGLAIHKPGNVLILFALLVAVPGLVIVRRQPGNPAGWLLLGFSALLALYQDATSYSVLDYHFDHGILPLGQAAVVIASELWSWLFLLLPLVILLFPDGRLPSRWRVAQWGYLAVCALITAALVAGGAWEVSTAPIVVDAQGQLVNNPGPPGVPLLPFIILVVAVPAFWVAFVTRQVLSWRRASGECRAQLKWLMAGSVTTVIGLAGQEAVGSTLAHSRRGLATRQFSTTLTHCDGRRQHGMLMSEPVTEVARGWSLVA